MALVGLYHKTFTAMFFPYPTKLNYYRNNYKNTTVISFIVLAFWTYL
jgi:hypothetical protein